MSFIKNKKEQELRQNKHYQEIINDKIDIIISATGCGKTEAYIMLQENCDSVTEVLNKYNFNY